MTSAEQVRKARGRPQSRGRPRTRPIARRIALLLAIPLLSLAALWAYSAVPALNDALRRAHFADNQDRVGGPSNMSMQAVQEERGAAIALLVSPSAATTQKFQEQVGKTDQAAALFRQSALSDEATSGESELQVQRLRDTADQLDQLAEVRSQVTARSVSAMAAINTYSEVFDNTARLLNTLVNIDDIDAYQQTTGLMHLYWARDFMLRQDLLLTSLRGSRLNATARAAFSEWAGARSELLSLGYSALEGKVAQTMDGLMQAPSLADYIALERAVVQQGRAPNPQQWRVATETVGQIWLGTSFQAGEVVQHDEIGPASRATQLRVWLAGGVGAAAVLLSVTLSLLFARRHARELRNLQRSAQELANERLPDVVARLRRGERVDLESETPRPESGRTREVAAVSEAFDTVQRTAISTAIGEADLRSSINRVFVNLSWRSQSLLHRQLRLLDQMERRAASPEELDDLFRLDHLTTRMRRHAEGLVILSGSPTVRAWDHPVAAEDVVRAAIAEVEDYTRIEMTGASSAAVTGEVVADVIHLLAELIENATAYSPPTTEVTVKIETVANGLAVEVVDRGIGLQPDELDELNRRLSNSVEFDLVDTERLGLFVVARLAVRHGIKVSLHPSPYGGTTAVVLVPHSLVVLDEAWQAHAGETPQALAAAQGGSARLGRPIRPALAGPASPPHPATGPAGPGGPGRPGGPAPNGGPAPAPADGAVSFNAPTGPPPAAGPPPSAGPPPPAGPPISFNPPPEPSGQANGRGPAPAGEADPAEQEDSELTGRLPRRIKQRNLAPQLRKRADSRQPEPSGPADDDFDEPSPELSRNLMSSLQSGWMRGRSAGDDLDDLDQPDEWGDS